MSNWNTIGVDGKDIEEEASSFWNTQKQSQIWI